MNITDIFLWINMNFCIVYVFFIATFKQFIENLVLRKKKNLCAIAYIYIPLPTIKQLKTTTYQSSKNYGSLVSKDM